MKDTQSFYDSTNAYFKELTKVGVQQSKQSGENEHNTLPASKGTQIMCWDLRSAPKWWSKREREEVKLVENIKTGITTLFQNEFVPLLSNSTFIEIYSKIWAMFKNPHTKIFFKHFS